MRVLMISPFFRPNVGGVETHLDDLCDYLRKNGHRVYVVTYQPLNNKIRAERIEKLNGLEVRRISWFGFEVFYRFEPYPFLELLYLGPILLFYALFYILRHKRCFDVIHGHGMNGMLAAAVLGTIFKIRCAGSMHTNYRISDKPSMAKFFKIVLSRLDSILVPSAEAKAELVSIGIDLRKIEVFRYWINQSVFRPLDKIDCRRKLELHENFVALFVGRLIGSKGVQEVLGAASELPEATFLFVGDGPLRDKVRTAAAARKNVKFVGKISNEALPLYYSAADVLVWGNPDVDYIGRVTIEALSCGLPVIAPSAVSILGVTKKVSMEFNHPPILTLIQPDSSSLVQKLQFILADSKKMGSLVSACRSYALEHFGEKNADIILRSYLPFDRE